MNNIDLSLLDTSQRADKGFALMLTHPRTGADLGITVNVLGEDSEAYQERFQFFQRRRMERLQKARRMAALTDDAEAEAIEMLVVCTVGWSDNMTLEQAPLPFSPENARKLYTHRGLRWLRDQVAAAIQERANFLPDSATN